MSRYERLRDALKDINRMPKGDSMIAALNGFLLALICMVEGDDESYQESLNVAKEASKS